MCRAEGEGGRRCQLGHTGAIKHNERRRKTRAIKRNVLLWAATHGCATAELKRLKDAPPIKVKDWAKEQGVNPEAFADGVPPGVLPNPGGSVPPHPASPTVDGDCSHATAGPSWAEESWCTPQLQQQLQTVLACQGGHRDERALLNGAPVRVTRLVSEEERYNTSSRSNPAVGRAGGTNTTMEVVLDNGAVGYFKPISGENRELAEDFGQATHLQGIHEVAAWRLASNLGPPWSDIAAPTVIRELDGQMGAFLLGKPGAVYDYDPWRSPEWQSAAFFDALIGQQDRHPGNYLVSGDRLSLIDHGYTFAVPGAYGNYSWFVAERCRRDEEQLSYDERLALERLLGSGDLLGLRQILESDRADALVERARRMLATGRITDRF